MKTIGKLALTGLVTVLPLAFTLYVLWWLGSGAEGVLGGLLRRVLPEGLYVPGTGLVVGLAFLVGLGLLMRAILVRRVARLFDRVMGRIPLVKSIYGSVADLLSLFTKKRVGHLEQVVLVPLGDTGVRILGLVTRPEAPELDAGVDGDPVAVVYVPMSYGIGGYAVLALRSSLTPVRMSVEQALRFAVTAGAPSKGP
jgi:uncharacterized membrane protein